jgi:uncharacterized cupin superfamily protein
VQKYLMQIDARVLSGGKAENMKMFELREWTILPDGIDQAPVHTHLTSDEVFYVLEGELEFLLGHQRSLFHAGSTVYVERGTAHTFANKSLNDARVLVIMTPEIAQLIDELHQSGLSESTRKAVWERFHSVVHLE